MSSTQVPIQGNISTGLEGVKQVLAITERGERVILTLNLRQNLRGILESLGHLGFTQTRSSEPKVMLADQIRADGRSTLADIFQTILAAGGEVRIESKLIPPEFLLRI